MSNQGRRRRSQQRQQNTIYELISEINRVDSLKKVFIPEKYALPGGWAYKTASSLGNDAMNSNQLRKVFTQLKTIEEKVDKNKDNVITDEQRNQVLLIMPQIAYAKGRNLISDSFYNLMKECINPEKMKDKEDYKSFVGFYTAVVAYSKLRT